MSLRLRLFVVLGLALVALVAAAYSIVEVVQDREAVRISNALASNEAVVEALARAYAERAPTNAADHGAEVEDALRAGAKRSLGSVIDTAGGYCWRDGFFIDEMSPSMRGGQGRGGERMGPPRPPGPPPDVRETLDAACANAVVGKVDEQRVSRTRDTMTVVVKGLGDGVAAFSMRHVPKRPPGERFGWSAQITAMAILTLAMVVVMADALLALRRGATDLETTLVRLEKDLRAEVPKPRARELARIAENLRTMAVHLADARDRERALEGKLSHEARLAALGRLVAGVAHEIRNPLTGVKLLLEGIKRRPVDAETKDDVDTCLGEIGRLDHVVTSLLGVARDARTEPVRFDLGELVDQRIATAAPHSQARDVKLSREGDVEVLAERDVLLRVLDNLLRNAVDASPHGERVEVVVTAIEGEASIDVIDSGAGVPKDREHELFEPFFTLKPDGTGLGLWLSRALAEARGGRVEYARADGRTHFTLRVPLDPRER